MIGMTARQRDLLAYLESRRDPVGVSVREIMNALGIRSYSNITRWLKALEDRGHIRRHYHKARSIELTAPAPIVIRGERYRYIPKSRAS